MMLPMRMKRILCVACAVVCFSTGATPQNGLKTILEKRGVQLIRAARNASAENSVRTYALFVQSLAAALEKEGNPGLSARLASGFADPARHDFPLAEFAWITHVFAREMYADSVIRNTAELIRFRTFATDTPNRKNPEFIRQKEFLHSLAVRLGLHFRDADGFIQEIWIGDGEESFGLMSHSDVQPVDTSGWIHDPWSGAIVDGRIWGRGTIDDKGPIVAVMFSMRAILDSGLPLKKRIILLVGTDEESANEDLDTYLKSHKAPDQTIVVDSNYPVICAEKGWCGAWVEIPGNTVQPPERGPYLVDMRGGFSSSIIPDKAVAKLMLAGSGNLDSLTRFKALLESEGGAFMLEHAGSRLSVERTGDTLVVTARGKSVHSSIPARGHNALMDLLVFIDRDVRPAMNAYALLARFAAQEIGFEQNGATLGIAHHDDFMGDVTVAGDMFQTTDTTVLFMFNFRVPRGVDSLSLEQALRKRYDEFEKNNSVRLKITHYIQTALYNDPGTPFVQRLMDIYNTVTGEKRSAQSIGGGTYAKRLPHAVVFGPAMPDEEYLGHQPNENIAIDTLLKNIELLAHTMTELGME